MIGWIQDADVQQFIVEHRSEDTYQLALKYAGKGKAFLDIALPQIRSWQKAKKKLPELSRIKDIVWPPPLSLEQSSSEKAAKFKASLLTGDICADLTGGSGVDTYYLSKRFQEVYYVDRDAGLCEIATHNFRILGANHIRVVNEDAASFIRSSERRFSAFYIDPDRRREGRRTYKPEESSPDVIGLMPEILRHADEIMIKFSPWLDLQSVIKKIPELKNIYVVAVENECREMLCLVKMGGEELRVEAVNISDKGKMQPFRFDFEEEKETNSRYALPMKYIYEPHAAILKAGAFRLVGKRYGLYKLHLNTHIYTADRLIEEFPGRKFELLGQMPIKKDLVKQALPSGSANLAIRNLGTTVVQLRKKLQIRDGGKDYLFAVTLRNGKPALLHCRRLSD